MTEADILEPHVLRDGKQPTCSCGMVFDGSANGGVKNIGITFAAHAIMALRGQAQAGMERAHLAERRVRIIARDFARVNTAMTDLLDNLPEVSRAEAAN